MVLFAEYTVAILFCSALSSKSREVAFSHTGGRKVQHSKTLKCRDTITTRTKEGQILVIVQNMINRIKDKIREYKAKTGTSRFDCPLGRTQNHRK